MGANFLYKKQDKINEIKDGFNDAKNQVVKVTIRGNLDIYAYSEKDLRAYQDVHFSIELEDGMDTIKAYSYNQEKDLYSEVYYKVTKKELYSIIKAMIDMGKQIWGKKEYLTTKAKLATSIEELELIKWG